jgi:hypothetical protein
VASNHALLDAKAPVEASVRRENFALYGIDFYGNVPILAADGVSRHSSQTWLDTKRRAS